VTLKNAPRRAKGDPGGNLGHYPQFENLLASLYLMRDV
jgi:hypothetical protein